MTVPRIKTFIVIIYAAVMLCVGLGLLGLLPFGRAFDIEALLHVLSSASVLLVVMILLSMFVSYAIVSWRWRLTTEAFAPGTHHSMSYLFYTALILLLAQVLPTTVCTFTVRNIAMRFHENIPLTRGTLSTLYDQIYEIIVPFVFVIPSLLVIMGVITPAYGVALSVAAGIAAVMIAARFGRGLTLFIVRLAGSVPMLRRMVAGVDLKDPSMLRHGIFRQSYITKMFGLAMLRYVNITLGACLASWSCNLDVGSLSIVLAMPLVYLTFLLGITPAAVGFVEWGWVGGLMLLGIPASDAAAYAVIYRMFLVASVVVVSLAIGTAYGILRLRGPIARLKSAYQEHRYA
jgi:xanthosine utilization system XapX-like protein